MGTDYNILRSKMLDYFRRRKEGTIDLYGLILNDFHNKGIDLDESDIRTVEQIIHEVYIEGVIAPGATPRVSHRQGQPLVFPYYHLTPYGEKVVSNRESQPHDPDGYLAYIKTEIPSIDAVITRYLEECLSCFRRNLLLAAATMLGCAAEKAVLLLAEAFGRSLSNPDEKQKYEKETKSFIISQKWEALWKRLKPLSPSLPPGLRDDLDTILERIFEIIRTTRNDAGHPTGKVIEKETVQANLWLFPIFCKRVYRLIQHFSPQ